MSFHYRKAHVWKGPSVTVWSPALEGKVALELEPGPGLRPPASASPGSGALR